jgi:hypothetical protein
MLILNSFLSLSLVHNLILPAIKVSYRFSFILIIQRSEL